MAGYQVMKGPGWMQLDRCGEHNAESHDSDASKNLTYEQIITVAHGVTIAQQQSAATLRKYANGWAIKPWKKQSSSSDLEHASSCKVVCYIGLMAQ
jgi:hypothetical protein